MFKKTSPQSSLFDPNMIVPGILPADDWSYIYREKIYPLIDEDKFRHLYDEGWGAPNKSIKMQYSRKGRKSALYSMTHYHPDNCSCC